MKGLGIGFFRVIISCLLTGVLVSIRTDTGSDEDGPV